MILTFRSPYRSSLNLPVWGQLVCHLAFYDMSSGQINSLHKAIYVYEFMDNIEIQLMEPILIHSFCLIIKKSVQLLFSNMSFKCSHRK